MPSREVTKLNQKATVKAAKSERFKIAENSKKTAKNSDSDNNDDDDSDNNDDESSGSSRSSKTELAKTKKPKSLKYVFGAAGSLAISKVIAEPLIAALNADNLSVKIVLIALWGLNQIFIVIISGLYVYKDIYTTVLSSKANRKLNFCILMFYIVAAIPSAISFSILNSRFIEKKTENSKEDHHSFTTPVKSHQDIYYSDFRAFMDDIQTEIFEVEFKEFSGGLPHISEPDFTRMLLRHAPVTNEDRKSYMLRIERKKSDEHITFDQFRVFCRLLNAIDDFTIAVKLYTFSDLPVSQTEFARAAKISTGFSLDPHLIDVIFKIFDVDDDGRLSYSEFIFIMEERLHKGFRIRPTSTEFWPMVKRCVREELKLY